MMPEHYLIMEICYLIQIHLRSNPSGLKTLFVIFVDCASVVSKEVLLTIRRIELSQSSICSSLFYAKACLQSSQIYLCLQFSNKIVSNLEFSFASGWACKNYQNFINFNQARCIQHCRENVSYTVFLIVFCWIFVKNVTWIFNLYWPLLLLLQLLHRFKRYSFFVNRRGHFSHCSIDSHKARFSHCSID